MPRTHNTRFFSFPLRPLYGLILGLALLGMSLSGCRGQAAPAWPGLALQAERLYVVAGAQVVALNPDTGTSLWHFAPEGKTFFTTPPALLQTAKDNALLVAHHQQGNLYALDPNTGKPRWQYENNGYPFIARVAYAQGLLLAPSSSGTLYALDAQGQVRWTFTATAPLWAEAVMHEGTAYLVSMDRHLYALDVGTGRLLWKENLDAAMAHGPLLHQGRLYIGTYGRGVKAFDLATRKVLWTALENAWVWHTPQMGEDTLYVGTSQGTVAALDPETGQVRWSREMGAAVIARPGWDPQRKTLYVATEDGGLWALQAQDGRVQWSRQEEAWDKKLYTEPLTNGSLLFLALHTGAEPAVLALDPDTGQVLWAFPAEE